MSQELLDGVPIIRIPANLRKAVHSPNPESSQSMSIFYAADAFTQAGYTVVYGGSMNTSNIMESGIYADYHRKPELQEQALGMIARAGLPILEDYHIEDAISLGQPVLAKNPYRHRGEQKYLLETDLQKAKFLTWIWLNSQQPHYFYENSTDEIHEQCLATIGLIYTGNYENILHWGSRRLLDWQFQEFVPPPLEHATSLRTLVDMRGNIIMGACVINPEKQIDRALAFDYDIEDSFDFALGH
ncbi:hypothetical protein KC909_05860, partial [Candidatus Dojkabacteria bacterium]|nr:hypothetical protein [Candidatus Dojkabacteria bacterium]